MVPIFPRLGVRRPRLPITALQRVKFLSLLTMLQVADIVTTNHALAAGNAWEANPVIALAMVHFGAIWWLPKLAFLAFAMLAVRRIRRRWPLNLVVSVLGVLVVNNLLYW